MFESSKNRFYCQVKVGCSLEKLTSCSKQPTDVVHGLYTKHRTYFILTPSCAFPEQKFLKFCVSSNFLHEFSQNFPTFSSSKNQNEAKLSKIFLLFFLQSFDELNLCCIVPKLYDFGLIFRNKISVKNHLLYCHLLTALNSTIFILFN